MTIHQRVWLKMAIVFAGMAAIYFASFYWPVIIGIALLVFVVSMFIGFTYAAILEYEKMQERNRNRSK